MTRRVLITGGASGLGLALANEYLAAGDQVLVGDLAPTRPDSVPERAAYLELDVRDQQDWDRALAQVTQDWGGLDVLVNNAGIATGGRIDVEAMADWERVLEINLLGVARGCHTFTPLLKAQGCGHIVNTASLAALVQSPGMASYSASKAGVLALSETLRWELEPFGITVSVLCPGFFRTNLAASYTGKDTAMQAAGQRLIDDAALSAAQVAATVKKALDKGTFLVQPDAFGRRTTFVRRWLHPLYARQMRAGARRLARKS